MNIINFQYANNYSNFNIPGYLYNIRKKSISHGKFGPEHHILISNNLLLYLKILFKYIKYFKKDRNILYNELKDFKRFLLNFKIYNSTTSIRDAKIFLNQVLNHKKISLNFKTFLKNLLFSFN
jgi:hypothetical protein